MKQTRSLSEFSCLFEFTRLYPTSSCIIPEVTPSPLLRSANKAARASGCPLPSLIGARSTTGGGGGGGGPGGGGAGAPPGAAGALVAPADLASPP